MPRLKPCRKAECSQKRGSYHSIRIREIEENVIYPQIAKLSPRLGASGAPTHNFNTEFRFMSRHAVWQEFSLGSRLVCMEAAGSYKITLFNFMTLRTLTAHVRQLDSNLSNGWGKKLVKWSWKGHEESKYYLWNNWRFLRAVILNLSFRIIWKNSM